jgi:hypothetical protein
MRWAREAVLKCHHIALVFVLSNSDLAAILLFLFVTMTIPSVYNGDGEDAHRGRNYRSRARASDAPDRNEDIKDMPGRV